MPLGSISIFSDLTSAEVSFVQNIAGLSYVTGDVLYYDGANILNLGIGSSTEVLTVSAGGIPEWAAPAAAGALESLSDVTITTVAQGDILYRNGASAWVNLPPGTSGKFLKTQGAAANPIWDTPSSSGDMLIATYDAAGVSEQLVGLTATQTLTGKSIDADGTGNVITNIGFPELDADLIYPAYNAWIGSSDTSITTSIASGGTVVLSATGSGTSDFDILFSDGFTTVDATPALTITLTEGSDASPQANYVYITKAAPTVLTKSTSGFPTGEEFFPIGTYMVQTAATAATYGVYKSHAWSDHIWEDTTQNGHMAHLNKWIRQQPATWQSGVALTPTLTPGSPDTLTFATSAGVVLQLHDHTMPAFDSATGGSTAATTFFVVNNTTAYTVGKDLYDFKLDSGGNAAGNNDRISWVVWGVVSEDTGDCKIMVNLPGGFYPNDSAAIADASKFTNYTIPSDYTGTGFLIAKLTYQYQTSGGGTLTLVEQVDLRGLFPGIAAGGSAVGGTTFADNVFQVYDDGDATAIMQFEASGITTATTRTLTIPDASGTLPLGTGTTNEITYWVDGNTIGALAVATYPSLTELSYVKGVTSALQTQLNAKEGTLTNSAGLAAALGDETGTGLAVFNDSPTLVTPALGTPASGVLTNTTGLPAASVVAGSFGTGAYVMDSSLQVQTIELGHATDTTFARVSAGVASIEGNNIITADIASSLTVAGVVELATTAEIDTGTDSTRAMPVDQFVASDRNLRFITFVLIDSATDVATATSIGGDFTIPFTGTIIQDDTDVDFFAAYTDTAGTTGTMVVDVHLNGTTIMTTNKLDIETGEKDTTTAATQPDLTTTAITKGDILTFDIDAVHTTAAKGLKVTIAIRQS